MHTPRVLPKWGHLGLSPGSCREHKAPNKAFTQVVQGNNKLHFTVKDFYLSWCYCELIEKLISPHNASLMKNDRAPVTRCQPFQKGDVLPLLLTGIVKGKPEASEALKTTQLAKNWQGRWFQV